MSGTVFVTYRLSSILDPQGEGNSSCIREPLASASNGQGLVISSHHTFCDNFIHDSAVYVYLRKTNELEGRRSLIFRYVDKPLEPLPNIRWINSKSVSILVKDIVQATKLVKLHDGVSINYDISHADFPSETWQSSPLTWWGGLLLLGCVFCIFLYIGKRALDVFFKGVSKSFFASLFES
jgi:hypothetical protein